MIFLKYKQPKAEYVQFQRFVAGLLVLFAVLTENILFAYAFLFLSIVSFITTIRYSPSTLLFKFTSLILTKQFFTTAPEYEHSYKVNRTATIFEDLMRIAGGISIIYFYEFSQITAWLIASAMAIAMLISSFFGFSLSALLYIWYLSMKKKFEI